MTRDDIMHLVNETAPRYQSWGIEAHFQLFAQRLLQIEREACARTVERARLQLDGRHGLTNETDHIATRIVEFLAAAVRARGGA